MRKINYSSTDLDRFSIRELQRICKYYDIEIDPEWDENKLKKLILGYAPMEYIEKTFDYSRFIPKYIELPEVPTFVNKKSARVIRIEENNRKDK